MTTSATTGRPRSAAGGSTAVKAVAAGLAPLMVSLAALGGLGSYTTVNAAAEPYFGHLAWIVPIGMDIGVLVLLAWDLLLEHLDLTWPVLRWIAWAYITGTVTVNISAAHGHPAAVVMHAAMPVLFISAMEGARHLIRHRTGLATGRRIEKIPVSRWLLAPLSTAALWRRMVLWHITSYRDGLRLEYQHNPVVSQLQQTYGRCAWRWRAPLADRLALQLYGILRAATGRLQVTYLEVARGARITYTSSDRDAIAAIHTWFDAQTHDHAMPGMGG